MSIETILRRKGADVTTIAPEASIKRAADWLRAKNIGALVVTSENAVLGLISEREIVHAFSRYGETAGSKLSSLHASKCGHCCLGCNGRAEVVGDEVGVRVAGRLDFFFGNSARIWACGSPNSPTLT